MAWRRDERAWGEDDEPAGLIIEFDDEFDFDDDDEDDEDDGVKPAAGAENRALAVVGQNAETEPAAGRNPRVGTALAELVAGRPPSRWASLPVRYRVAAAVTVIALAAGSVTAVRLIREARQRARERFTLAVVTDRYQPAISEVGLNLGLTLVNHGPAPVTVVFLQVSQPGLRLAFYPVQVPLSVGTPTAFTLVGVFDCQATAAATDASTVDVTVSSQTGISSVTLGLKAGSVPPPGWQQQRTAFCASPASH